MIAPARSCRVANKADRAEIPIYRSWCPGAGESADNAREVMALDAPTAARVHAERMTDLAWKVALKSPDDVCVKCNRRREDHQVRHIFTPDRDARSVAIVVHDEHGLVGTYIVRRVMKPAFEVIV